jgi:DNA invertase Pin-like site-specific DNA recombinase
LIDHLGISRPIQDFQLRKRALTIYDKSRLSGFQKEVERLRDIVLNARDELKTFAQEDMDTDTNSDKGLDDNGISSADEQEVHDDSGVHGAGEDANEVELKNC